MSVMIGSQAAFATSCMWCRLRSNCAGAHAFAGAMWGRMGGVARPCVKTAGRTADGETADSRLAGKIQEIYSQRRATTYQTCTAAGHQTCSGRDKEAS